MSTAVFGEIISLLHIHSFIKSSLNPFVHLGHFQAE